MAVKLVYAADDIGTLTHITKSKPNGSYYCPECKNQVSARKGNKNAHHFAHKKNISCTSTPESIAHFEAKHHLIEAVKRRNNPLLSFDFGSFSPLVNQVSSLLAVNPKHSIPLMDIIDSYVESPIAEAEKQCGPFRIDVLVYNNHYVRKHFALEVKVTHASVEEKITYFKENHIPYIELTPTTDHKGQISFEVYDYHLPGFFEPIEQEYNQRLADLIYNEVKPQLIQKINREQTAIDETQLKIKAVKALKNKISDIDLVTPFGTADESEHKYYETFTMFSGVEQTLELRDIEKKFSNDNKLSVLINGQYWVNNPAGQYFDIVEMLANNFAVDIKIGRYKNSNKASVQGIGVHLPSRKAWEKQIHGKIKNILDGFIKQFNEKLEKQKNEFHE